MGSEMCIRDRDIDGKTIRNVNVSKFLGVYIDKNLSWREHIAKVIRRVRQTVGIIGRARSFMNETQLLLLYNTMVLPHLQYCLLIWGNFAGDSNLKLRDEITRLQKSLVRIISNSGRISHADPLFARLSILKVGDLYRQALRVFSFKAFSDKLPGGVSCLLYTSPSPRDLSTSRMPSSA